jgi:hypothetical protein
VLPRLPFLWCYGVFRYSVSLWVILVFKDNIYVIIIIYISNIWLSVSTFGRMYGTIDPGSCIRCVLGFSIKPYMTVFWQEHKTWGYGKLSTLKLSIREVPPLMLSLCCWPILVYQHQLFLFLLTIGSYTSICLVLKNKPKSWIICIRVHHGDPGVTPTFYKNNFFVHIGVHIKMHIKL